MSECCVFFLVWLIQSLWLLLFPNISTDYGLVAWWLGIHSLLARWRIFRLCRELSHILIFSCWKCSQNIDFSHFIFPCFFIPYFSVEVESVHGMYLIPSRLWVLNPNGHTFTCWIQFGDGMRHMTEVEGGVAKKENDLINSFRNMFHGNL